MDVVAPEDRPHPWYRYWARSVDILFAIPIGVFTILFFDPHALTTDSSFWAGILFSLLLWNFIEAGFLALLATTPGKALFRIRVTADDGGKLGYVQALRRSFDVWARGLGLGIPIVTAVTMLVARHKLLENGETPWDRQGASRVEHGKVGILSWIVLAVIYYVVLVISTYPEPQPWGY